MIAVPRCEGQSIGHLRTCASVAYGPAIYVLAGKPSGAKAEAARATLNRIAADTAAAPQLQTNGTTRLEGDAGALLVTLARKAVQLHVSVRQQGLSRRIPAAQTRPHS